MLKRWPSFSLLLAVKMPKERDKLKKKLFNQKKPELEDLENNQLVQIAVAKKACFRDKHQECGRKPFVRDYTCDSCMQSCDSWIQPSQQKPRIEICLFRNVLWRTLFSDGLDPSRLHRRLTRVLRNLCQQKCCQFRL